ncbi:sensor histidine kinase [Mesorhizobium sp. Root157]|uniref:TspO/MBR family protein n=1 Tax=Mesorhizobium sp. Root157 TaxID=1736477 RepID=UPI0007022491|nr:TspO/MBR family protein [Mesorhizobium sp. Root157]KQZ92259.1 sensor histidine kinase [Mesorhizobium sp. Root157]
MSISTESGERRPRGLISAVAFVTIIVAISLGIGYLTAPGEWYESLNKPAFNPPSWVFGPVWTALYILIAIAGWRIWRIAGRSGAMMLWIAQMILNWLWSPAFFGAEAPSLALALICSMLASILFFIAQAWRHDRWSAGLFVPYAVWVAFATTLNGSIVFLNQSPS